MDLASHYGGLGYIKINQKSKKWFDHFINLGLSPEIMIAPVIDGENSEILMHLLRKIENFQDEYIKDLVEEYAIDTNDNEMLALVRSK